MIPSIIVNKKCDDEE